jgi:NTE family protein
MAPANPRRVAVVVAGAGARGGYEAGALSVLVPRLRAAGVETQIFVGTSAGAINATIFAALSHLQPAEQAEGALEIWRRMSVAEVFRSPLVTSPGAAVRFVGQVLQVPGLQLTNLLDTEPLRRTAQDAIDWAQLRRNIAGRDTTLAVVATSGGDNRTVVFVDRDGNGAVPPPDDDRPIAYAAVSIGPEHVMASSAIPVVFPPVRVNSPEGWADWYLDGGIRLNAPLKPALALGADAIVVVATHPVIDPATTTPASDTPPDVDDVIVRLMDAALVDRMVEDVRTLAKVNSLVGSADVTTRTGRPCRAIPYLAVCPAERGTLGKLAEEIFEKHRRHPSGVMPWLRHVELRVLGYALGGDGPRRGDLFSYLYFDEEFISASIELGRSDAESLFEGLAPDEVPWMLSFQTTRSEENHAGL